jgi:hypothetical protein
MPAFLLPLLLQLVPILSPIVVNLVERATDAVGAKLPGWAKVLLNALTGLGSATATGTDPVAGLLLSQVGNRVREALNK